MRYRYLSWNTGAKPLVLQTCTFLYLFICLFYCARTATADCGLVIFASLPVKWSMRKAGFPAIEMACSCGEVA